MFFDDWSQVLRLVSMVTTSSGTIVAAVARFLDEKEKRSGKSSPNQSRAWKVSLIAVAVAILGFTLGLANEAASQRKASIAATKAAVQAAEQAQRSEEMLEQLRVQSEGVSDSLKGVKRLLTAFDDVGFSLWIDLPTSGPDILAYRAHISTLASDCLSKWTESHDGDFGDNVRTGGRVRGPDGLLQPPTRIAISSPSRHMPDAQTYPMLHLYLTQLRPEMQFYVNSHNSREVTPPYVLRRLGQRDLSVNGIPELNSITYDINDKVLQVHLHVTSSVRSSYRTGRLSSLEDLKSAHVLTTLPLNLPSEHAVYELCRNTRLKLATVFISSRFYWIREFKQLTTQPVPVWAYTFPATDEAIEALTR